MIRIGKQRTAQKQKPVSKNPVSRQALRWYAYAQGKWVRMMQKLTAGLTPRSWKLLLAAFILLFGSYSLWLAVRGFAGSKAGALSITPIKKPRHIAETGEIAPVAAALSEAEFDRLKAFRLYLDCLARSPGGRAAYDSITLRHPGLPDSLRNIEAYYQQLKTK